jgi:hypothetical protein
VFKDIGIYDIASKTWFTQKASGQIPEDRKQFGGGVSWPSDLSSFNMYVTRAQQVSHKVITGIATYMVDSGSDKIRPGKCVLHANSVSSSNSHSSYDDVYILSIPAFVWIKWYPSGNDTQGFAHGALTGNVINGTQMIIMGGNFTYTDMCDASEIQGQHSLSLGQNNPEGAEWSFFVEDLTNVKVPASVVKLIGGTYVSFPLPTLDRRLLIQVYQIGWGRKCDRTHQRKLD